MEGSGRIRRGEPGAAAAGPARGRRPSPPLGRPPLEGRARRTSALPALEGSLPGHPPHSPLRPGDGGGAQPGRPSAGSRAARRRRLRSPRRARLPWLPWGLAPAAAVDGPPSPPTCPDRHVGRKRRVTQRPNGCRGGSGGGGGAAGPELPRRGEAGGGGRRGRSGPSRGATVARRGLAASRVRLRAAWGVAGVPRRWAARAARRRAAGPTRRRGPQAALLPLRRFPADPERARSPFHPRGRGVARVAPCRPQRFTCRARSVLSGRVNGLRDRARPLREPLPAS